MMKRLSEGYKAVGNAQMLSRDHRTIRRFERVSPQGRKTNELRRK